MRTKKDNPGVSLASGVIASRHIAEATRTRAPAATRPPATNWLDRRLLRWICALIGSPPIEVCLWDGHCLKAAAQSGYRVHIRDRRALFDLLRNPELHFGDLYASGRVEIEGDLDGFLASVYRAMFAPQTGYRRRPQPIWPTRGRPQDNIRYHYDIGNDFYRLWLDQEHMQYTCAYYPEPRLSLEQAQTAKLHHVCRKLQLRPGETVVEAGSGWGGLALFMARHYGVRVRAYNISREQIAYSRERAQREKLNDRVEFIEADWREIRGRYDAFVSVGMLEHLGREAYRGLAGVVERCLGPQGRGLIHSIGRTRPTRFNPWIERRIFPGAYPPTLAEMAAMFESTAMTIRDIENLRPHYAQTLRHWLQRFDRHAATLAQSMGVEFVRAWRLYLAGSAAAFDTGQLHLFQLLFSRSCDATEPWSRAYMYPPPSATL